MKFYKRDPDRALSGMAELTLKQRGAYNSLIDLLYSRGGIVPDDDLRVSKMISCHWREWHAAKTELIELGKIWVDDGGNLQAKRVQETIKEASDFSQTQSRRVSGRWVKPKKPKKNSYPPIPGGSTNTPTATPTATPRIEEASLRSASSSTEAVTGSVQDPPASAVKLLTNVKNEHVTLSSDQIGKFTEAYPAVDVETEVKAIGAWLFSNPTKRKTRTGMLRFVNSWLARAHDKGGRSPFAKPANGAVPTERPVPHGSADYFRSGAIIRLSDKKREAQ